MRTSLHRVPVLRGPRRVPPRGRPLARLGRRLRDDRGSLTAAMVIWTPVVLLLTAFVVDTGFLISRRERASDLAEQAARRVADDLSVPALRQGLFVVDTDPDGRCVTDAENYLTVSGVDPATTHVSACVVAGDGGTAQPDQVTVTVTVQLTYRPLFAGMVLSGPVTVTGVGTAHPVDG